MIAYVLTDIEGTTTPISFVHDVLFPYSKEHLGEFVQDPEAQARLLRWIEEDRKEPELKTLQGKIWRQGYESGQLLSLLYDDVVPALKAWRANGLKLGVYSSGSVEAQKLLFKFTEHGDLTPLFGDYFDTAVGAKREAKSYREIIDRLALAASAVLFLSDVVEELDAAKTAGMQTVQLVRPGTKAGTVHRTAATFADVTGLL